MNDVELRFVDGWRQMSTQVAAVNRSKGFGIINNCPRCQGAGWTGAVFAPNEDGETDGREYCAPCRGSGFKDGVRPSSPTEKLALIVTEVGEAVEAVRYGNPPSDHIAQHSGLAEELADAVIRLMNMATEEGIDLPIVIVDKTNFNATRSFRHGGKRF